MTKSNGGERRQSARLADSFSFHLAYKGFDIISDTINVSPTGLLCRVDRAIPLMEKIAIVVLAPNHKPAEKAVQIKAEGVVVRCEPEEGSKRHQVAIFFTDISDTHKRHLEEYIRHRLDRKGPK